MLLLNSTGVKRWIKYFQLLLPYLYILQKVDHLIIGEVSKKKRYDFIASSKPKNYNWILSGM